MATEARFPLKFQPLFTPSRYKILHGGRGGGRSWACARALLIRATQGTLTILCAREFQNSIAESVHKLLSEQISELGLDSYFVVEKQKIYCPSTGSTFSFEGIRNNILRIKSYEGVDICWVEEAQAVTEASWRILIPTIRKSGSEIWVTFNPNLETDPTYKRFVLKPQPNSIVIESTFKDNPYLSDEILLEMETMKGDDYEGYLNIWEGKCKATLDSAVYRKELVKVLSETRICKVEVDTTFSVQTFWDLGYADATSIWFAQYIAGQYRFVDYYQNSQENLDHYLQVVLAKPYIYSSHWLPHDAKAKRLGTHRTIEEQVRAKTSVPVRIVPNLRIDDGLAAARSIFPHCWFDAERCADGVHSLQHYRFEEKKTEDGGKSMTDKPLHDEFSHGADAFRYAALCLTADRSPRGDRLGGAGKKPKSVAPPWITPGGSFGWMLG